MGSDKRSDWPPSGLMPGARRPSQSAVSARRFGKGKSYDAARACVVGSAAARKLGDFEEVK
jgi:hypothetical protein